MLAGAILGMSFFAVVGAPEGLAVLALETKGSISDVKVLQENFSVLVQADVALPIVPGDDLTSLSVLLGCVKMDEVCLSQVADSLQVRWVLYASVSQESDTLSLEAALFDVTRKKDVATSKGSLRSSGDREGLSRVIQELISGEEAAALRRPLSDDEGASLPGYAMPVALTTAGGLLGGAFLFLFTNRNNIDFPAEGKALATLAVAADVTLAAAGLSFLVIRARRKKIKASASLVPGGAMLLFSYTPQGGAP